jgi:hypothetical protein
MKRFLANGLRYALAGVTLFLSLAMARATAVVFSRSGMGRDALPAALGFLGMVGVICLGFKFHGIYVFGHELTHWLAAKLFRRRTSGFRVGVKGGSVRVERPNLFIVLSPYFVPLYSLVVVGVFGVYLAFANRAPDWLAFGFQVILGATYGFHVALTMSALWVGQADMRIFGRAFSLSVVVLGNTLVLFLVSMVASRQWGTGVDLLWGNLRDQWSVLMHGIDYVVRLGRGHRGLG